MRRFDALGIADSGTWFGFPALSLSLQSDERIVDALPDTIFAPLAVTGIHGVPVREVVRHHPPLTAAPHDIADSVDNFAPRNGFAKGTLAKGWQKWFNDLPLGIGEVAGVSGAFHPISLANSLS